MLSVSVGPYLPKRDHALLRTHATSLDHDEVIVNFTVMREATHGRDALVGKIILRRSIVLHNLSAKNIAINIDL